MHRGERKRGEGEERKRERSGGGRKYARACGRERERGRESEFVEHAFAALPTDRVCMRACVQHARKSGRVSARFVMQCNVFSRLARPHLPAFVFANTVSDINIVRRCA